ncbi:MAG: aminotransferase class I/II-fold pyridoxal phosphate-dependent enzyme, partial [Bacteroidales bacterium]
MALVNENFLKLPGNYLFSDIAKKVNAFKVIHPEAKLIRLGIGDVTRPIAPAVIQALHSAVEEMGNEETFRGYGPEQGYRFLIDAVIKNDYEPLGVKLDSDEVFISDGAKSDTGNIGDILRRDNRVAVTDPVYPVYVDTNVMGGRAGELGEDGRWNNIVYIPCNAENSFIPELPKNRVDMIYLCYPNNPTGTVLTKKELKKWVDYALEHEVLILFDAAYEAFIKED